MPVSVFTVNKELSSPSKSLRSPRARPAPPPHAPPRRPRSERRGCGWGPRPTTPSALARPLRPPRRTSHRLGATPTEHRIYIHKELNLHKHLIIHTRLHAVRDVRIAPGAGLSDSAVTLTPRRKFIAGCFGGRSPGVRRASPPLPTAPIPSRSLCVPQCLWA